MRYDRVPAVQARRDEALADGGMGAALSSGRQFDAVRSIFQFPPRVAASRLHLHLSYCLLIPPMTPEYRSISAWAQREREADLDWISENLEILWAAAKLAHEDEGRGTIVIDTTIQPIPGAGNPCTWFSQALMGDHVGVQSLGRIAALIGTFPAIAMFLIS